MNIHHGKALWDNLDKMHAKQYFIGKYIQKRMKNNKLPYGMEYMNGLAVGVRCRLWNTKL